MLSSIIIKLMQSTAVRGHEESAWEAAYGAGAGLGRRRCFLPATPSSLTPR